MLLVILAVAVGDHWELQRTFLQGKKLFILICMMVFHFDFHDGLWLLLTESLVACEQIRWKWRRQAMAAQQSSHASLVERHKVFRLRRSVQALWRQWGLSHSSLQVFSCRWAHEIDCFSAPYEWLAQYCALFLTLVNMNTAGNCNMGKYKSDSETWCKSSARLIFSQVNIYFMMWCHCNTTCPNTCLRVRAYASRWYSMRLWMPTRWQVPFYWWTLQYQILSLLILLLE